MIQEGRDFLNHLRVERALSPNTLQAYEQDLLQYLEFCDLQKLPPLNATLKDMRAYLARLRRAELAPRTLARKLSTLRQFYQFLLREEKIQEDPAELISVLLKPRKLPKTLSVQEMHLLLETPDVATEVGIRDRALLELWYATGCRISELVHLGVGDIDFEGRCARFVGKGSRERMVPVHDQALGLIRRYLEVRHQWVQRTGMDDEERLFLNRRGRPFTRQGMWKVVKQIADASGLNRKMWPHMIRHSFATHVLEGGADLRAVQELLGHRSISTTEIYTHLNTESLRDMQMKFHPRN